MTNSLRSSAILESTVYEELAKTIFSNAKEAGAERIVFFDGDYYFPPLDVNEIARALEVRAPKKIKFQKKEEGKYLDLGAFKKPGFFVDALPGDMRVKSLHILDLERYKGWLRKSLYDAVPKNNKKNVDSLTALFNCIAEHQVDEARYAKSYIETLLAENYDEYDKNYPSEAQITTPEHAASAMLRGCVVSKQNRMEAERIFQGIKSSEFSATVNWFGFDLGYNTYFSVTKSDYLQAEKDLKQVADQIHIVNCKNKAAIIASMDIRFFRIYAPLLIYVAHHTEGIDFHFVIIGDDHEDAACWSSAQQLHLAKLTGFASKGAVVFHRVTVPEYVVYPRTFYACARYFVAPQLINFYERVYVMDADLMPKDNMMPYINKLNAGVSINENKGFLSLFPWRRILAGNAAFVGLGSSEFLRHAITYMLKGLRYDNSWMLDQNALLYASEKSEYHCLVNQPFMQLPVRSVWEKNCI